MLDLVFIHNTPLLKAIVAERKTENKNRPLVNREIKINLYNQNVFLLPIS